MCSPASARRLARCLALQALFEIDCVAHAPGAVVDGRLADEQVAEMPDPDVRVRLGDLLPLVAVAQRMNFLWLKDFLDDEKEAK